MFLLIGAPIGATFSGVMWLLTRKNVTTWDKKEQLYNFLTQIGYPKGATTAPESTATDSTASDL